MNVKDTSIKILLTIPAIIYGIYIVFGKPIINWLAKKELLRPVIILWSKKN